MILLSITQKVNANDGILGFYVKWLEGLARRVDQLQVIALEVGPHDLPSNTEVISLGKERGVSRRGQFLNFHRTMRRLCKQARPDAILAHMVPRYVLYALPWALPLRIPVDLWYTHKGVDKYLRMAHPFIRHAFTASDASFRLPSRKKIVTGHGIDTELFKPPATGNREGLLTVGRITPSKDQEVLVRALALLKARGLQANTNTRIVGEPLLASDRDYRTRLDEILRAEFLEKTVAFTGAIPHDRMVDCYGEARVMVNASHTGSVDKVVLEAMATGAIPITCNESFVPLLGDLAADLVFEKGNPEDLALRIERILTLPKNESQSLRQRLRAIVEEHHNLDRLLDRIVRLMAPTE